MRLAMRLGSPVLGRPLGPGETITLENTFCDNFCVEVSIFSEVVREVDGISANLSDNLLHPMCVYVCVVFSVFVSRQAEPRKEKRGGRLSTERVRR